MHGGKETTDDKGQYLSIGETGLSSLAMNEVLIRSMQTYFGIIIMAMRERLPRLLEGLLGQLYQFYNT